MATDDNAVIGSSLLNLLGGVSLDGAQAPPEDEVIEQMAVSFRALLLSVITGQSPLRNQAASFGGGGDAGLWQETVQASGRRDRPAPAEDPLLARDREVEEAHVGTHACLRYLFPGMDPSIASYSSHMTELWMLQQAANNLIERTGAGLACSIPHLLGVEIVGT